MFPDKRRTAEGSSHLWAIAYDDVEGAARLRDEIVRLGWEQHDLLLLDVAVVVRHADGSFTFDRKPFPGITNILGCAAVGFLAGLVVFAPLSGAAIGAAVGFAGTAAAAVAAGIGQDFILDVTGLMQPGTSALFVLDAEGDMDVILYGIRGLGGTVVKTNVDLERANLIQSTLAASVADPSMQPT
jgi:uncharacterized membrane protein